MTTIYYKNNMDSKLLLVKIITLLYREMQLSNNIEKNNELISKALEILHVPEQSSGFNEVRELLFNLKEFAKELLNGVYPEGIDKTTLIQRLAMICKDDNSIYDVFITGINPELTENELKKNIVSLSYSISNTIKEFNITEKLSKASFLLKHQRDKIPDINKFLQDLSLELENFSTVTDKTDPAILESIDLSDDDSLEKILNEVKDRKEGGLVLRTGWQEFNYVLQGGIHRGQFMNISALPHKYKSQLTLSLFAQIAMYNTPYMVDPSKKPLLLRLSFEDTLADNTKFLYQYLKYDINREEVDVKNMDDISSIKTFIRDTLQINGYTIKFHRMNPLLCTYKSIINMILDYESQGYEVHLAMLDYLECLPTTGCNGKAAGEDLMDMIAKVRMFMSSKKIACINTHHISTEAKTQFIRNGIPEVDFVKDIAGKGYYKKSKQLDNIFDLDAYIHIFEVDDKWYLSFMRGKHKGMSSQIPTSKKFFMYQFPKPIGEIPDLQLPIPSDLNGENLAIRKLPSKHSNDNSLFEF